MDTNSIRVARLKALVQAEGGVTEFARRRSSPNADKPIDTSYISQLLNGHRSFGEKSARSMERRAGLPEGYFDGRDEISPGGEHPLVKHTTNATEISAGGVAAHHPDDPLGEDDVLVPEYRVSFSAGTGSAPEYEIVEEAEPAIYKMSWFRKERINPKSAKRFSVRHDSMIPLLYPGDTILVNLAENNMERLVEGSVYAIRYGSELRIKRLFRQLNGTLILRSENPAYRDEEVPPELAEEHIAIIGRVRDKSGSGGL